MTLLGFIFTLLGIAIVEVVFQTLSQKFKEDKNLPALIFLLLFAIGFMFVYPIAFIWTLEFSIGYTITYWQAFMLIVVLRTFIKGVDSRNES